MFVCTFIGTSVHTDSGWTNGITNLHLGWNAIKTGKCDTAIVGVAQLQSHALLTIQVNDFGVLSPDGMTRSFDDSGTYKLNFKKLNLSM